MRKFVLGVIFILFAHQSIPATAATICGRDVAGTNDSDVLIGYWQLPNGSQLCAGLVVNKTTKTTAEYVYGKGTRVHLIGEYDGSTYTLHDQQGSTFIFRPDGSASFVGGSGNLAGRFSRIDSDAANAETSRPGTLNSFE